jgi:MFS family permease
MTMTTPQTRATYSGILRRRGLAGLLGAAMIGRLTSGMVPFGAVALYSDQQRYTAAGLAFATFLIAGALTGPWRGRLVDRHSAVRVLPALTIPFVGLVTVAALTSSLPWAIISIAGFGLAAALSPPGGAVLRTVWTAISLTEDEKKALHSLDSVLEELTFVISPLVVSAIWVTASPRLATTIGGMTAAVSITLLILFAKVAGTGVWQAFTHLAPTAADPVVGDGVPKARRSLVRERNGIALLAPMAGLGLALGVVGVLMPAWAAQHYRPELSGVLLSVISAGGTLSGLVYGKVSLKPSRWVQYAAAGTLVAAGVITLAATQLLAVGLLATLIIGIGMTPMFIIGYLLVGDAVPRARLTETNSALRSAYNIGSGGGAASIGLLVTLTSIPLSLLATAAVVLTLSACSLLGSDIASTDDTV